MGQSTMTDAEFIMRAMANAYVGRVLAYGYYQLRIGRPETEVAPETAKMLRAMKQHMPSAAILFEEVAAGLEHNVRTNGPANP